MPKASPSAVRKQISAGTPDPVYVLQGQDDLEKSALAAEFAELVEADLRVFNVERIHPTEVTTGDKLADCVGTLISAVQTLPMLAPRRVVVVMQAEALLTPRRESAAAAGALERLTKLLTQPVASSVLVLVVGGLDRRGGMYKLLTKHATMVDCGVMESQGDAERWLKTHAAAAGAVIDARAARLIAERAGLDADRLRSTLERVLLYTLGQKSITVDDVKDLVRAPALQDRWAMVNAIERADARQALVQLALLLEAGDQPEMILGQLGWLVRSKFPAAAPDDLRRALDLLFQTDLDIKRSAGDPRVLLERLVVELCRGKRARGAETGRY
jgi:DNA polymerase III subunit delta